jgi:hypothetical protein
MPINTIGTGDGRAEDMVARDLGVDLDGDRFTLLSVRALTVTRVKSAIIGRRL